MKFICDSCSQLTESDSVRVDGGEVILTCAICGAETHLEEQAGTEAATDDSSGESAQQRAEAALTAPVAGTGSPMESAEPARTLGEELPLKCPKCFHRQHRRDHCERCGLDLTGKTLDPRLFEPSAEGNEVAHARALELWTAIEADPSDESRHETFLQHCTDNKLLELCVRRYRERLSDHPDEEPTDTYLAMVVGRMEKVALAMLEGDAWAKDLQGKVKRVKAVLIVVAVVLFILAVVILALVLKNRQDILPVDL